MRYVLENDVIKVEIDSLGAEIKSVRRKRDDREFMWHGDPAYWGRTSPVLFPFVGAVRNQEYRHNGTVYSMGQHGFARDREFVLASQPEDGIRFVLESDEETLQRYPFFFRLSIEYQLRGNEVKVLWNVENTGEEKMYFSIGAHPAFLCPIHGEADKQGYGLAFGGLTTEIFHHGNTAAGMAVMQEERLALQEGKVVFTDGFFDKCTYMFEGKQTGEVSLLDREQRAYVTVKFDTPLFAVWSPEGKNAPFVCIEPWYGRCDAEGFDGELKDRDYENMLEPGGCFEASYRMAFRE